MARITVEDCLEKEKNRFSLVFLASKRAKELISGKSPVVDTRGNKAVVSALREIAGGKVKFAEEHAGDDIDSETGIDDIALDKIINNASLDTSSN
jgi:DNA-directed RNA polymerase subunit omega